MQHYLLLAFISLSRTYFTFIIQKSFQMIVSISSRRHPCFQITNPKALFFSFCKENIWKGLSCHFRCKHTGSNQLMPWICIKELPDLDKNSGEWQHCLPEPWLVLWTESCSPLAPRIQINLLSELSRVHTKQKTLNEILNLNREKHSWKETSSLDSQVHKPAPSP